MTERITTIQGEYTNAKFMGLSLDQVEDNVVEQVQQFCDHRAFTQPVRVMADCHWAPNATIGFTMPLDGNPKVVPNVVGGDIGCGVMAVQLDGNLPPSEASLLELDETVRDVVPMSYHLHDDSGYHIGNEFPWDICRSKLSQFREVTGRDVDPDHFDGYDVEYFKELCDRVGYGVTDAINSVGTLGGGNHFIEFGVSEQTGKDWLTIHSGSRGLGGSIADYWQEQAVNMTHAREFQDRFRDTLSSNEWMIDYLKFDPEESGPGEIKDWIFGGMGESFYDMEQIRADFEGEEIESVRQEMQDLVPDDRDEGMDYLEGEEAAGYFIDMIFAQQYAMLNRIQMADRIESETDIRLSRSTAIHSIHNFISFEDGVMRKGACRAANGDQVVIPMNMGEGVLLARGKGNDSFNQSAPHGAGRVMSRTKAKRDIDMEDFEEEMSDVTSTSVTEDTLDESPASYKDSDLIRDAIGPTAEVYDRLVPKLNIKALD